MAFIGCLVCSLLSATCFIYITSFNSHNNSKRKQHYYTYFIWWSWSTERLRYFLMIIQLVSSRTEYKPKEFGSRSHTLYSCTMLAFLYQLKRTIKNGYQFLLKGEKSYDWFIKSHYFYWEIVLSKKIHEVLVAHLCLTHCNPIDSHQASLSMESSRQEYWSW